MCIQKQKEKEKENAKRETLLALTQKQRKRLNNKKQVVGINNTKNYLIFQKLRNSDYPILFDAKQPKKQNLAQYREVLGCELL